MPLALPLKGPSGVRSVQTDVIRLDYTLHAQPLAKPEGIGATDDWG